MQNMKRFISLVIALAMFAASTKATPLCEDNDTTLLIQSLHLPPTAYVMAEEQDLMLLANVDGVANDMDVVTLWTYSPKERKLKRLLTTNPNGDYQIRCYGDKARKVSPSSIPTVSSAFVNASENKILIEGYDDRNSYSFIIDLNAEMTILQLPYNAGTLGLSSEELLPVAQSYLYYRHGGRYSVISVFDWNGKCVKQISLKGKR